MKHQYFGDVNDYRKYGLLRCVASATGMPIGVHWMLTADDGRTDGNFRRYLQQPERWRDRDPALYDSLRQMLDPAVQRSVRHADAWNLIPGAQYFDELILDGRTARALAMQKGAAHLNDCPIIFFDPDNGIEVKSKPVGWKGSHKYVYWTELMNVFEAGKSLVVYQHYSRVERREYERERATQFTETLSGVRVLTFKTKYAAFFVALRPEHADHASKISGYVAKHWTGEIDLIGDIT